MVAKLTTRLRLHNFYSDYFLIAMRTKDKIWLGDKIRVALKDNSQQKLLKLVKLVFSYHWHGETITQVQVTALHLCSCKQLDLFSATRTFKLNKTIDDIVSYYPN